LKLRLPAPAAAVADNNQVLTADSGFRLDDLFMGSGLPESIQGLGMEFDAGDGWQPMEPTRTVPIRAGMSFRPAANREGAAGLFLADGSVISLTDNSLLASTDQGFQLRGGVMSVNTPDRMTESMRLHFSERDVSVRPETFLAVMVEPAEKYAAGGAPAPKIAVADGGLAVARGRYGSGPLLANHVYAIDNYVSPDLPSRTLGPSECEELEKQFPASFMSAPINPALLVSMGENGGFRPTGSGARPSYLSETTPLGFTQKNSRWVADSYAGQPTIGVQYLSDAFFAFADKHRNLAPALALGPDTILDGGDGKFYEIVR
jgi:hypothetical protein